MPAIWQLSGYVMALFLAGFRGIPSELREAAMVDGATHVPALPARALPAADPGRAVGADHHRPHVDEDVRPDHVGLRRRSGSPRCRRSTSGRRCSPATTPRPPRSRSFLLLFVAVLIVPYLIYVYRAEKTPMTADRSGPARPRRRPRRCRPAARIDRPTRRWRAPSSTLLLIFFVIVVLMPVYVLVVTSFKSGAEIGVTGQWNLPAPLDAGSLEQGLGPRSARRSAGPSSWPSRSRSSRR